MKKIEYAILKKKTSQKKKEKKPKNPMEILEMELINFI